MQWNKNSEITNSELFFKSWLLTGDVSTVIMNLLEIIDMPAAVRAFNCDTSSDLSYTTQRIQLTAHYVLCILYVFFALLLLLTYVILVMHLMESCLIGCSEILCKSLYHGQESGRKWQTHADWNHLVLENSCSTYVILWRWGNICV